MADQKMAGYWLREVSSETSKSDLIAFPGTCIGWGDDYIGRSYCGRCGTGLRDTDWAFPGQKETFGRENDFTGRCEKCFEFMFSGLLERER